MKTKAEKDSLQEIINKYEEKQRNNAFVQTPLALLETCGQDVT